MPKTKRLQTPLSGLISLSLLGLLSGCATSTVTEYLRDVPPAYLLTPCVAPSPLVSTNGELLTYVDALHQTLRSCNDDKTTLREWATSGVPK